MCGGWLAALELSRQSLWMYHASRILTYAVIGALAATFGAALKGFGNATAWVAITWILAQAFFQMFGDIKFMKFNKLNHWLTAIQHRALAKTRARNGAWKWRDAWILGAATGLLPCGWLYSFVAVAAVAGHPVLGALTMLVFGLGTLPAMAVFGLFFRKGIRWLEARFPRFRAQWVSAAMLVVTAAWIGIQNFRPHSHTHSHSTSGHNEHDHHHP
jgi:sulfite exporter TauE/SafE